MLLGFYAPNTERCKALFQVRRHVENTRRCQSSSDDEVWLDKGIIYWIRRGLGLIRKIYATERAFCMSTMKGESGHKAHVGEDESL